jgi:shikimate dehydrogenase
MREAGPRTFALLGHPVGHSLSPELHRAAFRALGIEADYEVMDVGRDALAATMRAVARRGGGNVTLPHKRLAASLLDSPSEAVRVTGACNCFWWDEGSGLAGENTDARGFLDAAKALRPGGWPASSVLLLGAGGAARAVLHACIEAGVASIDVLNRTVRRARAMVSEVAGPGAPVRVLDGADKGPAGAGSPGPEPGRSGAALALPPGIRADRYEMIVNATRLGLDPQDPVPLALEAARDCVVLDLVYGREETRWIRHARSLGLEAADGLRMLIGQAAASLSCWLGEEAPLDAMTEAARLATGRAP